MDVSFSAISSGAFNADTPQRLLDAAGEMLAEHGFRKTTIREICKLAGANIEAVNYYFRDKEGLYSSVLQYAHQSTSKKYSPS